MNNLDYDPWDDVQLSPQDTVDIYNNKSDSNSKKDPWDELDFDEGFWKNAFRTASQIPQGIAEATKYGIGAGLFQMLALGESDLGIEEWHKLRELAEREGIPFDEEAYEQARHEMLGIIPTVSNISRKIEEETGLPLEPKTFLQKLTRLGSLAGKFQPGSVSQKASAAVAAPATAAGLESVGVPEQLAELGGLGVGAIAGGKTPSIDVSLTKTKPSGLSARQFEKTTKPKEISQKRLGKINEKLESDFKEISDKIIAESPVGETFENLKNDPTFKSESRELLNEAQEIADTTPGIVKSIDIKKEIANRGEKRIQGYSESEYDKSYSKFMKETIDGISEKDITASQLVKQYRKNNAALSEYFEPGSSKALNRAKRDALLDHNRTIADVLEKNFPESELSNVFKEGNDRWTKVMDAEAVDDFVNELFKDGVNYKKMNNFFDKQGYEFKFKRALGEKGYKDFQGLVKDMLTSETPYKMLKAAKAKGFEDLFKTGFAYFLHPKLGAAKFGLNVAKDSYKGLVNSLLDKPQLTVRFKKGLDNLKKGNFAEAEKELTALKGEIQIPEKSTSQKVEGETIEVKPEKISKTKEFSTKFSKNENTTGRPSIDVFDKSGKEIAGIEYSPLFDKVYLEGIWSIKPGGADHAMKTFLEKFKNKDIFITPMTEKGSKYFEKLTGKKIQPRIIRGETIQQTMARERKEYQMTQEDKTKIQEYLNSKKSK